MGVYIKGMEMPTSCYLCPCNKDDGFGFFTCGVTHSECDFIRLPTDCPLIPIPPHGRLIDADAMQAEWFNLNFDRKISDGTLAYWNYRLSQMPTIILAEGDE